MTGYFPTGADLVQAAVEFANKVRESGNLGILFTEPGHLPALLWGKAVETHFRQFSTPVSSSLGVRIGYALEDCLQHKYEKSSLAQGEVVKSTLSSVNDESREQDDLENIKRAFVKGRYFLDVSGSSHAIVQFYFTFAHSAEELRFPTERLEIDVGKNYRGNRVKGQVLTINPAQIVLQSVRSMMQATIGRSVSHSVEWLPIVMLFKLFRVVDPDQLKPPLSPLSHS
ncbi:hypothetical protein JCM3765_006435 [Sporobolomyces pararoseus]